VFSGVSTAGLNSLLKDYSSPPQRLKASLKRRPSPEGEPRYESLVFPRTMKPGPSQNLLAVVAWPRWAGFPWQRRLPPLQRKDGAPRGLVREEERLRQDWPACLAPWGVQRSLVGSPRLCRGLRCLRMTLGDLVCRDSGADSLLHTGELHSQKVLYQFLALGC
jgi:hypothetical protein